MKSLLLCLFFQTLHAELINKIVGVFDEKIITLAQTQRILQTLKARKTISPKYADKENFSLQDIVKIEVESYLIRNKLEEMGYIIDNAQVENQIKETEKRLNLSREALLQFLTSNNMTFEEYFDLVKQSIEHNIFSGRVIEPLVTISDQEIKNTFYKKNLGDNTFTFKYALEDFSINKNDIDSADKMVMAAKNQKAGASIPPEFSSITSSSLGNVTEDTLSPELSSLLKNTNEGEFSNPILMGNFYHVFFVQKKDLVESEIFNQAKDKIKMEIYINKSQEIIKLWMAREVTKHFVKYFD